MQAARTNIDMKPRRTPCFFSKPSLYFARISMARVISTSFQVVSMAAVFWASFRRDAITLRSRVIFTRSSSGFSGRGGRASKDGRAGALPGVAAGRLAGLEPPCMKFTTSALVRRPSLPEAGMSAAFRPLSAIIFLTAGGRGLDRSGLLPAGTEAAGGGGGGEEGLASCFSGFASAFSSFGASFLSSFGASALAEPSAPSSIIASRAPTSTSAPSSAMISPIAPATGELTSRVTLSVSSSQIASSTATASPGFFIQLATIASVTDSPSCGTFTSTAMVQDAPQITGYRTPLASGLLFCG